MPRDNLDGMTAIMAKGRIRSRMELREQYEAAEARERADRGDQEDEQEEEAAEVEEPAEEAEAEEEAPVKKPKKKAAPKEPSKRKKTAKLVPKRVVWVVYDNSYKKVKTFPYSQKKEAEEEAERLRQDKKTTYFVQPFKEDIPS
jgi:hypothetical protein